MARPASGGLVEHVSEIDGRTHRYLRFRYEGKRHVCKLGVVSPQEADAKLELLKAELRCGSEPTALREKRERETVALAEPPPQVPTFADYANGWFALNEGQWSENTRNDYHWRLSILLATFGDARIDQITGAAVKRYVADRVADGEKIREHNHQRAAQGKGPLREMISDKRGHEYERPAKPLSSRSINMTVTLLGAILKDARDDDDLGPLMPRNAAEGRRIRERAPARTYLDTAEHIAALLDAAGKLDAGAKVDRRHVHRRAMIATLTFAGLRIGELLALRWRDVDIASGWLTVGQAKTDAGVRKVKLRPALRDELAIVRATVEGSPDDYVFPSRSGGQMSAENFRNRVLAAAVKRADETLTAHDSPPLPKLTPHSLRRTFASLLYAIGEPATVVMQEMGHTDPALALKLYAQAMRRDESQQAQLRALVDGVLANQWANEAPSESHRSLAQLPK